VAALALALPLGYMIGRMRRPSAAHAAQ
jgi:hypothetical protein